MRKNTQLEHTLAVVRCCSCSGLEVTDLGLVARYRHIFVMSATMLSYMSAELVCHQVNVSSPLRLCCKRSLALWLLLLFKSLNVTVCDLHDCSIQSADLWPAKLAYQYAYFPNKNV